MASKYAHDAGLPNLPEIVHHVLFDGGFSIAADGSPAPDHGYMVSIPGAEERIPVTAQDLPQQILDYYRRHAGALKRPWRYFGGWVDGNTLYLDISIHVEREVDARKLGATNGQQAIWDCAKSEAIFIPD